MGLPGNLKQHRDKRGKLQTESSRPANTRDNQMARGEHNIISNRSQYIWASSEHSSPNTEIPEYTNTLENQEADLKSYFKKIIESIKEDINNSLKEIQENISKQIKALTEEANKSLKEIQENTNR
jgi:DNA anti-recombination protein RmuC